MVEMKGYLESKFIPKTEDILNREKWKIDRWDGVVSLADEDYRVGYEGGVTIGYRKVVVKLSLHDHAILFDFSTIKDSNLIKEKHLKTKPPEVWFQVMEELAITLAKELGLSKIIVSSGRKDKTFLLSKGYKQEKYYFYHKAI